MLPTLILIAGVSGGTAGHPALHPRATDLYVEMPDVAAMMQAYRTAPPARFLDDEGVQKLGGLTVQMGLDFGAILRAATPRLSTDPAAQGLFVAGDLSAASISFSGLDPAPGEPSELAQRVGILVVCDFASAEGARNMDAALQRAGWLESAAAPATPESPAAGGSAEELELDGQRAVLTRHHLDAPLFELEAWTVTLGARWVLGAGRATPQDLARRRADPASSLPAHTELFAAEQGFGPQQGTLVARIHSDLATVPFAGPDDVMFSAMLSTMLPFAGARGVWRIQLQGERFVTESAYTRLDAQNPLDRLVTRSPVQRASAAAIPETAVGAWLGQVRASELPALFETWMGEPPAEDKSAPDPARAARLGELFEKGLGSNAVVSLLPFAGIQSLVPQVLVSLDVEDRAAAAAALEALVEHVRSARRDIAIEERAYRKIPLTTFTASAEKKETASASVLSAVPLLGTLGSDAPTPCFALLEDRLLIALKPAHVRTEIQRREKQAAEGKPPAPHALAQEARCPADAVEVSTLDWSGLFGKLYDLVRGFAPMLSQGQPLPFDPASLPASSSFTKFFQPSFSWTRKTEHGLYTRAESSFGPETPLTILALFDGLQGNASPMGAMLAGGAPRPNGGAERAAGGANGTAPKPESAKPARDDTRERTLAALRAVKTGVAVYRSQKGKAPATLAELLAPTESFPKGFLDPPQLPKDAWGRELRFEPDAQGGKYKLWSLGADGIDQQGTGDDVALP